jgi:hypothetical protein
MQKPESQRGNNAFDLELLQAADSLLHEKRSFFGTPGEIFKGQIEADHECETSEEVSALAFSLFETYRRIREKLDEYSTPASQMFSYVKKISTKEEKVAACDVVMKFILTGESFTRTCLNVYVDAERKAGRLKQEDYDSYLLATGQGALKTLLDAMFEVQKKVERLGLQPH